MDRKRSRLGLGPEIAESKVEESGIADSKIIQYPLIFTPPPRKLLAYVFDQFILDEGLKYALKIPGCNFSVVIEESPNYKSVKSVNQTEFHCDIAFEDAFISRKLLIHSVHRAKAVFGNTRNRNSSEISGIASKDEMGKSVEIPNRGFGTS